MRARVHAHARAPNMMETVKNLRVGPSSENLGPGYAEGRFLIDDNRKLKMHPLTSISYVYIYGSYAVLCAVRFACLVGGI